MAFSGLFSRPNKGTAPAPTSTSTANDNAKAAIEQLVQQPVVKPPKPGILVVTLHEARGLALPDLDTYSPHHQASMSTGNAKISGYPRPGSSQRTVAGSYMGSSGRPHTSAGGFSGFPTNHGRVLTKYLPYALIDFDKNQVLVNSISGTPENPMWAGDNTQYKFDVSRVTELIVRLYIRNPNAPPGPAGPGRGHDIPIGVARIYPRFEEKHTFVEDPKASKKDRAKAAAEFEARERELGFSGTGWVDVDVETGMGTSQGKLKVNVQYVENRKEKLSIDDFELLTVVGKGSFGKVMQVRKKDTNRIYALKTIRKAHIISRSEVAHTLAERSVLAQINNPFIVPLKFTFQSPEKLYFVLAFVNGGELFFHLQNEKRFDVDRSRFYTAELLCALECLHGFNVIYRDLKPENILLDYEGHIALCDFGLCKLDMKDGERTRTFCGTPEYLAPELLSEEGQRKGYTKTVDWWTLGILLFEMLKGLPPFYHEVTSEMYKKILHKPLVFDENIKDLSRPENDPDNMVVPPDAQDLLRKLLDRNPEKRLGVNGSHEIREHPFFKGKINWQELLQRKTKPLFRPRVMDATDVGNFDTDFTNEVPQDSYVEGPMLSQTQQDQFANFSYNRPVEGLGDGGGSIQDHSYISNIQDRYR